MKAFNIVSVILIVLLSSFSTLNNENPYTQLTNFSNNGGEFEDNIHVYIVEFRRSNYVNAKVDYDKSSQRIRISFKDSDGSMHHEEIEGIQPHVHQDTPSVITFDNNNDEDEIFVSVMEYEGKLSVIWNGEDYHMVK